MLAYVNNNVITLSNPSSDNKYLNSLTMSSADAENTPFTFHGLSGLDSFIFSRDGKTMFKKVFTSGEKGDDLWI